MASLFSKDGRNLRRCERLGKLLSVQLDPTVRSLLGVLQQYQAQAASRAAPNAENEPLIRISSRLEDEERILGLLRAEADLLWQLQVILLQFLSSISFRQERSPLLQQEVAASVAMLLDYVSLPVVAVLRRPLTETLVYDNDKRRGLRGTPEPSMGEVQTRRLLIRRAAERRSATVAARTLALYLESVRDGFSSGGITSLSLPVSTEKILKFVLACAAALPIGREIPLQATSPFVDRERENGEDQIRSLFETVSTLVWLGERRCAGTCECFGVRLSASLNGFLLARLVDACLCAMALSSSIQETTLLVVLKTFQSLLVAVPSVFVWRGLFPGCFAGLFRVIVRAVAFKPKAVVTSLQAFTQLLVLSLNGDSICEEDRTGSALAELKHITTSGDASYVATHESADMSTRGSFLSEINKRLPGPLNSLAKLLLESPSDTVRQEAINLYRTIVVDTRTSWEKDVLEDLSTVSLECCLILLRDSNHTIVAAAHSVLESYLTARTSPRDMNLFLVPRIVAMIEELPAMAQGTSRWDLRNQLKLITAFMSFNHSKCTGPKSLRLTLAAEGVFLRFRRAISSLLTMDYSTSKLRHSGSIEVQRRRLIHTKPLMFVEHYSYKWLTADCVEEVVAMIHGLAEILGPKQTAIAIDGTVADLFNSTSSRYKKRISRSGKSQLVWCHKWIGCLGLIRELLRGGFSEKVDESQAAVQSKKKHLNALATSVLPIFVSSPLWDLPLPCFQRQDREDARAAMTQGPVKALKTSSYNVRSVALQGNACFICGLIQIVGVILQLLQEEATSFLPTVLPPILHKASLTKKGEACVAETCIEALEKLTISTGSGNRAAMFDQNLKVISGSILATLRLPGGRSSSLVDYEPVEIYEVSQTIMLVFQEILCGCNEEKYSNLFTDRCNLPCVIEVVATLTERYDMLGSTSASDLDTAIALVNVYQATFCLLSRAYRTEAAAARERAPLNTGSKPWLESLGSLRTLRVALGSPLARDAFLNTKEASADEMNPETRLVSVFETRFSSLLVSRCTFLLSHSSLELQFRSCAAMARGFEFLALVASICKVAGGSIGIAFRRQVNDAWPSILARLVTLADEVQAAHAVGIVIARQPGLLTPLNIDVSTKRLFLSVLFDVVAIVTKFMAEDFIGSRFTNDVFPLLSRLMCSFVEELLPSELQNDMPSNEPNSINDEQSLSPCSEASLIASVLQCLEVVYKQDRCSKALADLIPVAGALVLPFLREDLGTAEACTAVLKVMIQVDCDALWRPIAQLSGKLHWLIKPWSLPVVQERAAFVACESVPLHLLESYAQDVVAFIDCRPEQALQ